MAAPVYVNASTGSTDTAGAWTHTCAAPAAAGNIIIIQVVVDGVTAGAPTISSITNAENLAGTDNVVTTIGSFNIGSAVVATQQLYICRSLSTSAPVITGGNVGGDDVYIRAYEFNNVSTGTTLATVIENSTAGSTANGAGTGTTISDTAVTTLGPDRLALNLVGANDDIAIDVFAGETGGDWAELVAEYAEASGTDAALQIQGSYVGPSAHLVGGGGATVQGAGGTNEEQAQSFASGAGGAVSSIMLNVEKNGSPTDDLIVEFQTDAAGVPSGTVVGTGATIPAASLPVIGWFTFPVSATLSASTTYWIVARRSGARDTGNFFGINGLIGDNYASGTPAARNSGTWTAGANDRAFAVSYTAGGTIDGGSDTVVSAGWGVVGFALIGTTVVAAAASDPTTWINDRRTPRRRSMQRW